jgi:rhamnogalacturonan acetylesterase
MVDSYYPYDHTHTNTAGAIQVASAFLSGLKCSAAQGVLAEYINMVGENAAARC